MREAINIASEAKARANEETKGLFTMGNMKQFIVSTSVTMMVIMLVITT